MELGKFRESLFQFLKHCKQSRLDEFPFLSSVMFHSNYMTPEFLVPWILESELCGDGLTFGYFTRRLLRSVNFDSAGTMREHRHLVIRCLDKSAVFFRK